MTDPLLDELKLIDPLPANSEPPPVHELIAHLDASAGELARRVEPGRAHARRHLARPAFAAAAVAAASLAAALALSDSHGGHLDVTAAALAATQQGSGIVHMSIVSERTVGGSTQTTRSQIWTAQNPRRIRTIHTDSEETLEGALTANPLRALQWSSSDPTVIKESAPGDVEATESSPVQVIHRLLAEGRAVLAGKTSYEGHEAWELQVHPDTPPASFAGKQLPDPVLIVAAGSYVPLELIDAFVINEHGKQELALAHERYVEYQELPSDAHDETLVQLAPHAGASVQREG